MPRLPGGSSGFKGFKGVLEGSRGHGFLGKKRVTVVSTPRELQGVAVGSTPGGLHGFPGV